MTKYFRDAEEVVAGVDSVIEQIHITMTRPGWHPLTSNQMRERERQRQFIASSIRNAGKKVRPDYEFLETTDAED